jgi:hypothetical protein
MSIQIFDNVLDTNYANTLFNECINKLQSGDELWKTNNSWPVGIIKSSHPVLIRMMDPANTEIILNSLLSKGFIQDKKYVVMNYLWTKLSYIPWHDDLHATEAMTLYLNPQWENDWGGYFLYADKSSVRNHVYQFQGFIPKFNTLVKNKNHILHSVTQVSLDVPYPRCTLQFFR